jgi:hypothetical protein
MILEFELSFMLANQALYHLSHTSSPFCSDYFGDGVLLFAQTSLDYDPHILCFLLGGQTCASQTFFARVGLEC